MSGQPSKSSCPGKVSYWTGQEGQAFEREYAEAHGCRYGVALANGTVALELGPARARSSSCRTPSSANLLSTARRLQQVDWAELTASPETALTNL